MKKICQTLKLFLCLALTLTLLNPAYSQQKELKPIEDVADIMAWKSTRAATLSADGTWFAYYLAPQEGNGKLIVKHTQQDKEFSFDIGAPPRYASSSNIRFSKDSQWLAFTVFPTRKEARKLQKQKKKTYNKTALLNLDSGGKSELEKIQSFSFSGENPQWIAFHKYPIEEQSQSKEKWKGTDLVLQNLETSSQLNLGNVAEFAFDKKGRWLATIIDTKGQIGNGVQIRNMKTGAILPLDSGKAEYTRLTWTEEGDGLTVLKGEEDKKYEDNIYSVLGFQGFDLESPEKYSYNPHQDSDFPDKMTISPNRAPLWTDDLSRILFGIHEVKKKEQGEKKEDSEENKEEPEEKSAPEKKPEDKIDKQDLPDLVIWHWLDKRLQSMQQVQERRDENFSYLSVYDVKEKKFFRLADEKVRQVSPAPKHNWAVGFDRKKYELDANLYGRRYQDIYVINLKTGKRELALEKCRWYFSPSPDGTHFLFYQKGDFFTYEMSTGQQHNITKDVPTSFIDTEDDHNVKKLPIYPTGWEKQGKSVLLYDNWDVWDVPVHKGEALNLTQIGKTKQIRFRRRFRLDPEEKGIDLEKPLYFSAYGEWTKKGGIALVNKNKPGAELLLWDDASFSIRKAEHADVFLYTKQTYKHYPDYYVTDSTLQNGKKLSHANPQQDEFLWSSGSMLVDYESQDGDRLQAALFLPAHYKKGQSYPTIVYIYEKLSQILNRYFMPSARGFNKSVYTSRGYAVLMPDIVYEINDPGISAVKCVIPAVKAAVETGVVDRDRIGIHGHSWGGYQTAFLITQTDLFEAAVAGAPLTNMISMYSSIYWNSGSANQPIFESSQGRFKGNYLENLVAYARNSPVYHAENVTTPLIILHNDKDGAVDWNQGIEYFNTLRQLKKPVVMLQYKGENHGLRKPANQKDYFVRMREFFDHHLMGKPAPAWLKQGIPHLELEEHIKERTAEILEKKEVKKKEK
ncbi:MAG: prolyl oligopeptidase family serine peptidase [Candidatus Aminicenantes bacterium]|nr:prolyl oligopeptidase family serine peptidase [Candidatus Aminicenantes bacterium]